MVRLALIVLLFCSGAAAQGKPLLVETLVLTVSNSLDDASTLQRIHQGYMEAAFPQGIAEFVGRRPSAARLLLTTGAIQAVSEWAAYRAERSNHLGWKVFGHTLLIEETVSHFRGFMHNETAP